MFILALQSAVASDFEHDGLYYTITGNSVTLSGCSLNLEGDLSIPETVSHDGNDYSVTSIGDNAFNYCMRLTSVTIPHSIRTIGNYAFFHCTGILSIPIPGSVIAIGHHAFYGCSALTSINIPSSIHSIEANTFFGCTELTSISIPNSVTNIGNSAFEGCTGLTSISIPNSVTNIGNSAFEGCTGLTSIIIPNSVTDMGSSVFYGCSNLTSVNLPNSFQTIFDYTFCGCTSLASITIPNSVNTIANYAFYGCSGLTSINIPNSVTSIGASSFYGCSGLTSLFIPNSVTFINYNAFTGCSGLTSIQVDNDNPNYDSRDDCNALIATETNTLMLGCKNTIIPGSVTMIGFAAFYRCTGLTSVSIPSSVNEIEPSAFEGCTGITSITIPNSVTAIWPRTFYDCSSLTSVTIPNSVTQIGDEAFYGCNELHTFVSEITNASNVSLGNEVFEGVSKTECVLYVPIESASSYHEADQWKEFTEIIGLDNYSLYVNMHRHTRGAKPITDELSINLRNTGPVNAIEFDLSFPALVSIEKINGMLSIWADEIRKSDHYVTFNQLEEYKYHIQLISTTNKELKDSIGPVLHANLQLPQYHASYDGDIVLSNIVLYKSDNTEMHLPECKAAILNYLLGDANGDLLVDVTDFDYAVLNLLGRETFSTFYLDAANVNNQDEIITVADLIGITNIALGIQPSELHHAPHRLQSEQTTDNSITLTAQYMGNNKVAISLTNDRPIAAMQMDIATPIGMRVADATTTGRASHLQAEMALTSDGHTRLLLSQFGLQDITPGNNEVVFLKLEGEASGNLALDNILACERNMVTHHLNDKVVSCSNTGIYPMADNHVIIYTEGHQIIIESPSPGTAQLSLLNGMTTSLPVKAGRNVYTAASGCYVIRMFNISTKLIIE